MVWSGFDVSYAIVGTVFKIFGSLILATRFICLQLFDRTEDTIRNLSDDLDCAEEKEMLDSMIRANPNDVYFKDWTFWERDWRMHKYQFYNYCCIPVFNFFDSGDNYILQESLLKKTEKESSIFLLEKKRKQVHRTQSHVSHFFLHGEDKTDNGEKSSLEQGTKQLSTISPNSKLCLVIGIERGVEFVFCSTCVYEP
jgi:hypothetical protein